MNKTFMTTDETNEKNDIHQHFDCEWEFPCTLSLKCQYKMTSEFHLKAKEKFPFYQNIAGDLTRVVQVHTSRLHPNSIRSTFIFLLYVLFRTFALSTLCRSVHVFNHFVRRTKSNDNMNEHKDKSVATPGVQFISHCRFACEQVRNYSPNRKGEHNQNNEKKGYACNNTMK